MIRAPKYPAWEEPIPEPRQIIVDVHFGDGAIVTLRHRTIRSANQHAESACEALLQMPTHPCGVRAVAVYRGREVRG